MSELRETICEVCSGPNPTWFADNALWNAVVADRYHFLCPNCFIRMAESQRADFPAWRLSLEADKDE